MRDLKADLEICNKATRGPWVFDEYDVDIWSQADPWRVANVGLHTDMEFIAAAREGWPHAIERAIKAEAEVERLKEEAHQDIEWLYKEYVLEADVNLSQDAIDLKRKLRDMVCKELQAENARLRKVVEAAREYKTAFDTAVANPNKHGMALYSLMDNVARAETLLFEALDE